MHCFHCDPATSVEPSKTVTVDFTLFDISIHLETSFVNSLRPILDVFKSTETTSRKS